MADYIAKCQVQGCVTFEIQDCESANEAKNKLAEYIRFGAVKGVIIREWTYDKYFYKSADIRKERG